MRDLSSRLMLRKLPLAGLVAVLFFTVAGPAAAKTKPQYYVSLGDSYAVGWQRLHGAVEVTGAPRNDVDHPTDPTRWRWVVEVEPLLAMRLISRAPKLEEINVSTKSVRRQSHIRIDQETFESAVDLLIRHGATGPLADARGR